MRSFITMSRTINFVCCPHIPFYRSRKGQESWDRKIGIWKERKNVDRGLTPSLVFHPVDLVGAHIHEMSEERFPPQRSGETEVTARGFGRGRSSLLGVGRGAARLISLVPLSPRWSATPLWLSGRARFHGLRCSLLKNEDRKTKICASCPAWSHYGGVCRAITCSKARMAPKSQSTCHA